MNNNVTIVAPRVNVADLEDTDIDGLVDLHIFGFDGWCEGRIDFTYSPSASPWQCSQCEATEDYARAALLIERHVRRIPCYTANMALAWRIVDVIKGRSKSVRARFVLSLRVLVKDSGVTAIFATTPRTICIAALQALGIVDRDGYIVNQGGAE